jgi:hypothetical protein
MYVIKHFDIRNPEILSTVYNKYFTWNEAKAFIDGIMYTESGVRKSYYNKDYFDKDIPSYVGDWGKTKDSCMRIGNYVYIIEKIENSYELCTSLR